MTATDPVAAAARCSALRDRRRLSEIAADAIGTPTDDEIGEAEERLDDELRTEHVAAAVQAATKTGTDGAGDRPRRAARAIVGFYLDRACRAQDSEIAERRGRARWSATGIEASLAFEDDPVERERLYSEWVALERSLEAARSARSDARNTAARAAGLASAFDLASAASPRDPRELLAEVERDALRALDDAIGRVRFAPGSHNNVPVSDRAALPRSLHLVAFTTDFARPRIAPVLRELGRTLGEDPDTHGPRLVRGRDAWDEAIVPPGERAVVVSGSADGPGGLRAALQAFGRAVRGGAIGRRRGPHAVIVADPAFDAAAATLFSRLMRSAPFRSWSGIRETEALASAVSLAEAWDVRRSWACLRSAADGTGPGENLDLYAPDTIETQGASDLRGAIFAILLEERLMTRHGRSWFLDRAAGRLLAELWEAEPDETAESMAAAMSLGRMTADVLLEGLRP